MDIFNKITDLTYGTRRNSQRYLTEHPDEKVLATKGIRTKGNKFFQVNHEKRPLCGKQIIALLSHDTSWSYKIGW